LAIQAGKGEELDRLRIDIGRKYLYGESLAHVLGYIGQVAPEELSGFGYRYQGGDLIGRGGVEQSFDLSLRGRKGREIFENDAFGEKVRSIGKIEPRPGEDLYLTIDARFSEVVFEALGRNLGAAVVTEAKTGKIFALATSPSFDPTKLSLGISAVDYQKILRDSRKPFFNRAIGGAYPPASTFKIVTAAAGLEEERITGKTKISDPGVIKIGPFSYHNWYFTQYGKTEGEINVAWALKRSTDTFFYKLGEWLGAYRLSDWAKNFGLGQKTGIDLPGEVAGLVPDPDWKREVKGERWFLGNTYHFAIGQADLTATPLQVNMMTGVIANGGRLCRPRVVETEAEIECLDLGLERETVEIVAEGMKEACLPEGTAVPFFDFEPRVACKTGTAQFGSSTGSGQARTHAWLTAFAPADDPEIVVTVLVEAGGEGSKVAAPIAKEIFEAWFN
jgi:penicillin-binding protein 2